MSSIKEGSSVYRPPLLDGKNYAYWKARMSAFIRSIDEKAWDAVEEGWSRPVDVKGATIAKSLWTADQISVAGANSKALNAIFSAVDVEVFKLISTCLTAKEAWDILQVNFEGTNKVRLQILQLLTSKFENLKMEDNEDIATFNSKLCDIANECYALGEKLTDEKLVRKVLRSLPKRFRYKVTAIEEAKDVTNMRLDELIGSLRTFEMGLTRGEEEKKKKEVAFVAEAQSDSSTNAQQELIKAFAMFSKSFSKTARRFNRGSNRNYKESDKERKKDL